MSSADEDPPVDICEVIEAEYVCPKGRGFTKETWHVWVNDGWISVYDLHQRPLRSMDTVTVAMVDGYDPAGRNHSGTVPPQYNWRRVTCVTAPRGTRLSRHTVHPIYAPVKERDLYEVFVLRGDYRLVPLAVDEERQRQRQAVPPEPLPKNQNFWFAQAALARVTDAATASLWRR
jgi:hypothetical protein